MGPVARPVLGRLRKLFADVPSGKKRVVAEAILRVAGDEEPAAIEMIRLTDRPSNIHLGDIEALGRLKVKKAVPRLTNLLTDEQPGTRLAAAAALITINLDNTPAARLELRAALRNRDKASMALKQISQLGKAASFALPELTDLLDNADAELRVRAAQAVLLIGPVQPATQDRVREILVKVMLDDDNTGSVRADAARALAGQARAGDPQAAKALMSEAVARVPVRDVRQEARSLSGR